MDNPSEFGNSPEPCRGGGVQREPEWEAHIVHHGTPPAPAWRHNSQGHGELGQRTSRLPTGRAGWEKRGKVSEVSLSTRKMCLLGDINEFSWSVNTNYGNVFEARNGCKSHQCVRFESEQRHNDTWIIFCAKRWKESTQCQVMQVCWSHGGLKNGMAIKNVFSTNMYLHVDARNYVCVSVAAYPGSDLLVKYNYWLVWHHSKWHI